jgi:hypothetical protein
MSMNTECLFVHAPVAPPPPRCAPLPSPQRTSRAPGPLAMDMVHQIFALENRPKKSLIAYHFAFKPLSLL